MKNKGALKKAAVALAVAAVWIALWTAASAAAKAAGVSLVFPSPLAVAKAFGALLTQKSFYVSCGKSMLRVLAGWAIGLLGGAVLALATAQSRVLRAFFGPALHIVKATPVASFIILALVVMGAGKVPAFTGALISLPVVWANLTEGFSAPDPKLLEMAKAFRMARKNRIKYIYLPALRPYFTAAATTAMGFAWKAGIAAEVICTPKGSIGAGIYNAKIYLETPELFAWTLAVIGLSVLLEALLKWALRLSQRRHTV